MKDSYLFCILQTRHSKGITAGQLPPSSRQGQPQAKGLTSVEDFHTAADGPARPPRQQEMHVQVRETTTLLNPGISIPWSKLRKMKANMAAKVHTFDVLCHFYSVIFK